MKARILFVYRSRRQQIFDNWRKDKEPDSQLFGLNHLRQMGYQVDFFDTAYSLLNPWHWLCYPLEHWFIGKTGMGFKLDQALTLLPRLKHYDMIVATADVAGLPLLWLKKLGLVKQPIIILGGATARPLKNLRGSWVWSFYKQLYQQADILTCYAKSEVEFFVKTMSLSANKTRYIPYCVDWKFFSRIVKNTRRKLLVSVGVDDSRDYYTLVEAIKDLDVRLVIACLPKNVTGLNIPSNVTVKFVDSYIKMRRLLNQAVLVVIPLREVNRSAGQRAALEAAAAATPMIVSRVTGMTTAYDFRNGQQLWYVTPNNAGVLKRRIKLSLADPESLKRMGRRASIYVRDHYSTRQLGQRLDAFIKQLA